jgi:two-component system, cell cycle sensor histidine kinase and response regulator CckA
MQPNAYAIEEQNRLFMEAVADHTIFLLDATGRVTTWNAGAERILGFTEDEVLGCNFALFFTPEDLAEAATVGRLSGDRWLVRKDGTRLWVNETLTALKDSGLAGFAVVIRDKTEQLRAEDALHREREFLRTVLENIQEAVVACDVQGNFTFANHVTHELGEPVREQVPAEEWMRQFSLYHPNGKTPMPEEDFPLFRALRGEQFRDVEMVLVPRQGTPQTVLASGQPLLDLQGNKRGAVMVLHDITDRRRLEHQFIKAQKMEAIGRLAGGISHDFNNHLTVINGCGHLLLLNLSPNDPSRELASEVIQAGGRAAVLVRQLLSFSRHQAMAPEVLDLNPVVTDLEKMLRRIIGENIALATNLQPTLGQVKVDPCQIEQVVMNLIINARDAMPRGGKLTIETRNVRLDESYCRTHANVRPGPYVLLAVSDTGCGMTEEVRECIFEPFFTTKGKGEGTGLGLAMAYGVVKQSGGQIEVYSEPGLGSTFKIYLPRVKGKAPAGKSWHGVSPAPPGNETVLLVEDDAVVRLFSRAALQQHGYTVLEAKDGTEAILVTQRHGGPIHILVTDVVLPQLSGPQLAERLLSLDPEMKVLFISGYPDDAVVRHGVLQEKVNFLQKPFSPEVLAHKVREVLDAEQ